MSTKNENNNIELSHYLDIIERFQKEQLKGEETEIWKSQLLIELMDILENTENVLLVRNSLILLISLFENIPPDLFNNRGIHANRLEDREPLVSILEAEFLPN